MEAVNGRAESGRMDVGCRYRSGSPAEVIGRLCRKLGKLVLLAQAWAEISAWIWHGRRGRGGEGERGRGESNKRESRETGRRSREGEKLGVISGDEESAVTRQDSVTGRPSLRRRQQSLLSSKTFSIIFRTDISYNMWNATPRLAREQPGRDGNQRSPEAEAPSLALTGLSRTRRHCVSAATQERRTRHAGDATAAAQRSHHRRKPAHRCRSRAAHSWESTDRQAVVHRHQMDGVSLPGWSSVSSSPPPRLGPLSRPPRPVQGGGYRKPELRLPFTRIPQSAGAVKVRPSFTRVIRIQIAAAPWISKSSRSPFPNQTPPNDLPAAYVHSPHPLPEPPSFSL